MLSALILSTYMGYVTVKHHCHDYDCKVVKKFGKLPCAVQFDGETATILGITSKVKQYMYGRTDGFDGNNGVHELTLFFRPRGKILRAYVSQYQTAKDYDRWTCEFNRENESEWGL